MNTVSEEVLITLRDIIQQQAITIEQLKSELVQLKEEHNLLLNEISQLFPLEKEI